MPAGRPSEFNQSIANTICTRLIHGESLRSICRDDDMPDVSTVYYWIHDYPEFSKQYDKAKMEQIDTFADEIIEIDYNKFYTSILQDTDVFPLVNSFDEFIDYNGEALDDLNIYYVEKTVENNEYPFYQFNLCMGKNIKGVKNINIIAVLDTSKNKSAVVKNSLKWYMRIPSSQQQ